MEKDAIIQEIGKTAKEYLAQQGLVLFEVLSHYEGSDLVLRILVDRPEGGITIQECAQVNKGIRALLDEKNIIPRGYLLEVSSPGIDRPLKTKDDFFRCQNRMVKFFLNTAVEGKVEWDGVITQVTEEQVSLACQDRTLQIPLTYINKAKQLIE
ncbi:MAG: ribosome maturation factor RimP [Candidatus Omnitrophica bacterium]|nr:ribosome maturation factor RimP [Candidatus Omnitrophota bacterium]